MCLVAPGGGSRNGDVAYGSGCSRSDQSDCERASMVRTQVDATVEVGSDNVARQPDRAAVTPQASKS